MEKRIKKVLLNFSQKETTGEIQDYLAEKMGFPSYYGRNLDALFDMLTDIAEPTAVCLFYDHAPRSVTGYLRKICSIFRDAEKENPNLAVFFEVWEDHFGITAASEAFDSLADDEHDG